MQLRGGRSRTCGQQVSQLTDTSCAPKSPGVVLCNVESSSGCLLLQPFSSCAAWQPVSTAADEHTCRNASMCSICNSLPVPQQGCGHMPAGQSGSPMYQNSAPATSSSQWDTESPTTAAGVPAAQAQRPGSGITASADPFAASVSHLHGPVCCALPEQLPVLPSQEAGMT